MSYLWEVLVDYAQEVTSALSKDEVPLRDWSRIVENPNGSVSFPTEKRPDTTMMGFAMVGIVERLGILAKAAEFVSSSSELSAKLLIDGAGKPIEDMDSIKWWLQTFLVLPFLADYFSEAGNYIFNGELCSNIAKAFCDDLLADTRTAVSITPVPNIELDKEELPIASGIMIRRPTIDELERWINPRFPVFGEGINATYVTRIQAIIETTEKYRVEGKATIITQSKQANDLVDAIRLLSNMDIVCLFTEVRFRGGRARGHLEMMPYYCPLSKLLVQAYKINDAEYVQICDLYRRLSSSSNASRIAIARKRWSNATEKASLEDRLIDYWVALESLFTPDSSVELSFRAALRIAAFSDSGPEQKEQIYSDMRRSYEWRSAIIHGDSMDAARVKKLSSKLSIQSAESKTRIALRNSIMKILQLDGDFIPEEIDKLLLSKI